MRTLAVAVVVCVGLAMSSPAWAQAPGQGSRTDIGGTQGKQTFTVKNHLIVWGSMGLDLDVIGDVTAGALGTVRDTQTLVSATAFPDVYVKTPRRRYLGVGFGAFDKTEIFARYTEANNPAATVIIGQFGSSSTTFPVVFDNYKDRMVEFGLRKYIATPKASRQYFALVGGMKTVEPLGAILQIPGGSVRTELYSKSRIPSIGLEFGISLEWHKMGIFLESGMHYQKRLTRNDNDLAQYGLETLNNTAVRIYIPVSAGLLVRF